MFIFTCGVALIGGHVQRLTNRNMEMVVNNVALHKLSATDKEFPIQFCSSIIIIMKVCGLVLSVSLLLSSAPEFTRGGRMSL